MSPLYLRRCKEDLFNESLLILDVGSDGYELETGRVFEMVDKK